MERVSNLQEAIDILTGSFVDCSPAHAFTDKTTVHIADAKLMAPCYISLVGKLRSDSEHEMGILITRDEIGDVRRRVITPPSSQTTERGAKRRKTDTGSDREGEDDDDSVMIIEESTASIGSTTGRDLLGFGRKGNARHKQKAKRQQQSVVSLHQFQETSAAHLFIQANLDHWLKKVPPGETRS